MPPSKSKLNLSQRRERAFEMFARGYTNVDVAKKLRVNKDTAANYRKAYEERIHAQAAANPGFLRDVLTNTIRALEELDQIRADANKQISEKRLVTHEIECENCGEVLVAELHMPMGDDARTKYLNVLLKAQDQRSKILGVLGVKAEVIAAMTQIKVVQDAIIRWLVENVKGELRDSLDDFLTTQLADYLGGTAQSEMFDGVLELESSELLTG